MDRMITELQKQDEEKKRKMKCQEVNEMGEIQEATQILRVSFEGIEIFMKIIGGGIHTAKRYRKIFW